MLAAGNFAIFSPFLAVYSTLDFTRGPEAGKETWCLLPTTPAMLPTATKHFGRAVGNLVSVVNINSHRPLGDMSCRRQQQNTACDCVGVT